MDFNKIFQLLSIEEKVRDHPKLKAIYDAVHEELNGHAKAVAEELAKHAEAKAAADKAEAAHAAKEKENEAKLAAAALHKPALKPETVGPVGPGALFVRAPAPPSPGEE